MFIIFIDNCLDFWKSRSFDIIILNELGNLNINFEV